MIGESIVDPKKKERNEALIKTLSESLEKNRRDARGKQMYVDTLNEARALAANSANISETGVKVQTMDVAELYQDSKDKIKADKEKA